MNQLPLRRTLSLLAAAVILTACSDREANAATEITLREKIAQKIMLDIRYYCGEREEHRSNVAAGNSHCAEPVTELPQELAQLITETGLGGIVLFADNLQDSAQIVRLNRALQDAALRSAPGQPLLIGIDQEGGRVNRLPREEAAAFAGNMAIGATYPVHGERFATESAAVMAEQVRALGFNVNFAPTLDVNSNPENPVINVRSYSEKPQVVADLGAASVRAFQRAGVAATVKHFPGHGDTSVDSHTGLPRVERSPELAHAVDLLPFKQVIAESAPALTMTAHIQYPSLDDSTLTSASGEEILVPATLSHRILSGILRQEFGYEGVIVTDALDMAGISNYFAADDAVVQTFAAGADIAVMPIKIRFAEDLATLSQLIDAVVQAVEQGKLSEAEIDRSVARIQMLKQEYVDRDWLVRSVDENITQAQAVLASPKHRELAEELAHAALSPIFPPAVDALPVIDSNVKKIQVIAPTPAVGDAFRIALKQVSDAEVTVLQPAEAVTAVKDSDADVLLVASIVPGESAVERGGMDDLPALRRVRLSIDELYDTYRQSLQFARDRGQKTVFISMRSPYEATRFLYLADVHLASFDYKAFIGNDDTLHGPIYTALAAALTAETLPQGSLPVTVQGGSSESAAADLSAGN